MPAPKHRANKLVKETPLVQPAGRHVGQFETGKHNADSADDGVREFSIGDLMEAAFTGNPFKGRSS